MNLINDLLEWSRSISNRIEFAPKDFSLDKLIDNVFYFLKPTAYIKKIELVNHIPKNTSVIADKNMIFTILRNLVSNAIKFSNRGGSITIGIESNKNTTKVFVKDEGIGI